MLKSTDQSTRLLCASVLLGHGGARDTVAGWIRDRNRSVAAELGIDLKLVLQVTRWAERRERRHWWAYFLICVVTVVAALMELSERQTGIVSVALGSIVAGIVWMRKQVQERNDFAACFTPARFNAEEVARRFGAPLNAGDITAIPAADQNFFAYGGFTPFVGAGHDLGGWSVAVATDKAREVLGRPASIKAFDAAALYSAIDIDVKSMGVSRIEANDCFFASGADLRHDRDLLPDIYGRPAQHLNPDIAKTYLYGDDEAVRHYRCYRVFDWGGELAYSYYLRCSLRGNTLFVETKKFLLTAIAQQYRAVDDSVTVHGKERVGLLLGGIIAGPFLLIFAPFLALAEVSRRFHEWRNTDKERRELIDKHPRFNYGTTSSLRHALSSGNYHHYFQMIDGDFYGKALERQVLDSLVEFLDERGIDTSELRERQTTIMNSGVIVQGGNVNAESLAVGAGARAVKKVKNALRAKAAGAGSGGGSAA